MTVTSPVTTLRTRLLGLVTAEFTAEAITVVSDKLDASLGSDGHYAGCYPEDEVEMPEDVNVQEADVVVQVFHQWDKQINPKQTVDPATIENWAERFKRACAADLSYVGNAHDWFYRVRRIEYPDDPTGNKTRFLAYVTGWAQNPAIVETTG